MDSYQDPSQQPYPPRKQGMGCFAKGCLTLFIILALMVGLLGFLGYKGYRTVMSYISDKPTEIRVYPATDAEYQAVEQKIQPFAQAMQSNQQATLQLSVDEVNTLVARDPNFADMRGKMYFAMENDDLAADMSFPLDGEKGQTPTKFFNGHVVTGLSVEDSEMVIAPKRFEANGKPTPAWLNQMFANKDFMKGINRSLNENFQSSPKARDFMSKLQSVQIRDSRLVVTSKGEPAVAPPAQ